MFVIKCWSVIEISVKCPECGSLFKKDNIKVEEIVICQICETQYKIVINAKGKLCLEIFDFDGNDLGEL